MVTFTLELFGGPRDGERLPVPSRDVRRVDLVAAPDVSVGELVRATPENLIDPAQRATYRRTEDWRRMADGLTFIARAEYVR